MALQFCLPDLGEGIAEAEVLHWLVSPGDQVTLDQELVEVQTDKAVVRLPSPTAGTIRSLAAHDGQVVNVGELLVTIDNTLGPEPVFQGALSGVEESASGEHVGVVGIAPTLTFYDSAKPTRGSSSDTTTGTVPIRQDSETDRLIPGRAAGGHQDSSIGDDNGREKISSGAVGNGRARATPAVRQLARSLRIDINSVPGSGPAGRVMAADVRQQAIATPAQQAAVSPPVSTSPWSSMSGHLTEERSDERVAVRGLRRRIAENMVKVATTVPQVTSMIEVDARQLVALRKQLLPLAEQRGVRLSYLPLIVKALVQALQMHPYLNSSWDEVAPQIVLRKNYHIGIATAIPDGLLVPVLRHADRLTTFEVAGELQRLTDGGRARTLAADELRGSTFTISNYGAVGGYFATPIINPGEAAILGLGQIGERALARDGVIIAAPVLPLSLTADHRIVDGEQIMLFLRDLVGLLEQQATLLATMR